MNALLFFDCETTDLPDWPKRSNLPHQPHLVEIAAILVDAETRSELAVISFLVKPEGWDIPQDVADKTHGVSVELATEFGITEKEVLELFLKLCADYKRVSYGRNFDHRIIRIATTRYSDKKTQEKWKDLGDPENKNFDCAISMTKKAMPPQKGFPTLIDAYKHFTGKELIGAHSALPDTRALIEVYFAMKDLETIEKEGVPKNEHATPESQAPITGASEDEIF